jgi:hypothetical protein
MLGCSALLVVATGFYCLDNGRWPLVAIILAFLKRLFSISVL